MLKSQILMKDLHIRSAKNSTQQTTSSAVTAVHLSPMIKILFLTISSITQSKKKFGQSLFPQMLLRQGEPAKIVECFKLHAAVGNAWNKGSDIIRTITYRSREKQHDTGERAYPCRA